MLFNNGLGPLKTKSGGGIQGGGRVGDVMGGDFVFRGPNPFLKSDQEPRRHGVAVRALDSGSEGPGFKSD